MFIADLHIHSAYSRATSREALPPQLEAAARRKGVGLLATGDFTHPVYRKLLSQQLCPAEEGLYCLREEFRLGGSSLAADQLRPRFIVSGEISSIYRDQGRVRKVHNVILLPSLEAAEGISLRLEALGCNLHSDGRPIIGLSSHDLLELTLDVCPEAIFIPAHIWTPHFSLFGAYSGYQTLEECYGDLSSHIHAVETGLSSDPAMNWRLSALDALTLISNSDAHSPDKLAREANLFSCPLSYPDLAQALQGPGLTGTIEFFPEEGKYHWDGHRNCHFSQDPQETIANGGLCPVCGKPLTVGVLHRVEELADRPVGYRPATAKPYESLAPLAEVIAAAWLVGPGGKAVRECQQSLLANLGDELHILRQAPLEDVRRLAGPCVEEALRRLRAGEVRVQPGFDGEYGRVEILSASDIHQLSGQAALFPELAALPGPPKRKRQAAAAAPATAATPTATTSKSSLPLGLSPAQWAAASAPEQAVAVLAGPGCGKTHTLVSRIAWLVQQGQEPSGITAVTFTNKAARELRQRLEQLLPPQQAAALHIGTFHGLCRQRAILRGEAKRLLDPYQCLTLAEQLCADTNCKPAALLAQAARVKNSGETPDQLTAAYLAAQKSRQAVDFDDILLLELTAATAPSADLSAFQQLLVDEFQDVNDVQFRLIQAWSRNSQGLFVIGDPDQSIYGFRGSDSHCFERLASHWPELRQYRLEENYRSGGAILSLAAAVLPPSVGRLQALNGPGEPVRAFVCGSPLNEGIAIAKTIDELVGGVNMLQAHSRTSQQAAFSLQDIAVLYRTHQQGELIGYCLEQEGIPYRVAGRDSLPHSPAVRRAIGFFRLLQDPGDGLLLRDSLYQAGVTVDEAEPLALAWEKKRQPTLTKLRQTLAQGDAPSLALREFCRSLAEFAPRIRRGRPGELLADWSQQQGLSQAEGMEKLLRTALMYDRLTPLLEDVLRGAEGDLSRSYSRLKPAEAVTLSTLHGAKGLEFPVVFLAGVKQGLIPLAGADSQEERRLFYVGLTRARQRLYLLTADPASSLLAQVPPDLLEWESHQRRAADKQLSWFEEE